MGSGRVTNLCVVMRRRPQVLRTRWWLVAGARQCPPGDICLLPGGRDRISNNKIRKVPSKKEIQKNLYFLLILVLKKEASYSSNKHLRRLAFCHLDTYQIHDNYMHLLFADLFVEFLR